MAVDAGGIASSVRQELGTGLRGEVIWPGDRGYDTARAVFNGMIDRRPLAVIRPCGCVRRGPLYHVRTSTRPPALGARGRSQRRRERGARRRRHA